MRPKITVKMTGGDALEALRKRAQKLAALEIGAGVPEPAASQRHDGSGSITNGELAAIVELGTDTIPARPFMAPAARDANLERQMAHATTAVLEKGASPRHELGAIAHDLAERMREHLGQGVMPVSEATHRQRRREGREGGIPDVRTGALLNAIGGRVTEKK